MGAMATASSARDLFDLSVDETHLNHGSFGAVPMTAVRRQVELQERQRLNFHRFYDRELFDLLEGSRRQVAGWLGAPEAGLVLERNASASMATAIAALELRPGDRLVTSDLEYPSTLANLRRAGHRAGAEIEVVSIRGLDPAEAAARLLSTVDGSTAAVVVSHVTSPWSTVVDVVAVHDGLREHRATLVVDGAHGAGLVEVDLSRMREAFYCLTLGKWMCFPRGTGALVVPESHRALAQPLVGTVFSSSPHLIERFSWAGTADATGFLVAEEVLAVHDRARVSAWDAAAEAVADHARVRVAEVLADAETVSHPQVRRMATWRLPGIDADRLATTLRDRGVWTWVGQAAGPTGPETMLRVSAGWYNTEEDVERLAVALGEL
jgi:isopenicillin-N epimerase